MTDRPALTADHYLDAIALCRATLRNDEAGLIAIANSTDVSKLWAGPGLPCRALGEANE